MQLKFFAFSATILLMIQGISSRSYWAGANCYFLHSLPEQSCTEILQAAQAADLKVLRIFINFVFENSKNTGNSQINDVEVLPGQYDDSILNQIDDLMYEAHTYGIKLIIAMHDRYAMTWPDEAYVKNMASLFLNKKNLMMLLSSTLTLMLADFDKRLNWILGHKNPHFGGRSWSEINETFFSFEAENEPMGHMDYVNPNWHCDRAQVIKGAVKNGILVSNGGGIDFPTSLREEFFICPYIDVICIHTYDRDIDEISEQVQGGRILAWKYGKRIIVEEFGADSEQDSVIPQQIQTIQILEIPWMFWEIMKPGAGGQDFGIWTDQNIWLSTIVPNSRAAADTLRGWSWPEIWAGDNYGFQPWD